MKLAYVLTITLGLMACGGKKSKTDGIIAKLDGFKTKICACKDKACLDGTRKERDDWMAAWEKEGKAGEADMEMPSEADGKRIETIGDETRACEDKIEQAGDDANGQANAAKVNGFADEACACKDEACGKAVMDKMSAWAATQKSDRASDVKISDATAKKQDEASKRLADCFAKLPNANAVAPH